MNGHELDAEVAPIPTVLPSSTQSLNTTLPVLPMSVLSIAMLGEFLSSNVSVPFLLFMVKGFGFSDEAEAAFWTGVLVSMFFLSQFLTSLLWATLAERCGRRFVLVVTLFGSAVSVTAFGLSKSIAQAICIRLVQGVFAGAVGVARGSVVFITDSSNEGRAYAILGFFWGFGGLLGPIIGGSFERPAERWQVFQHWQILHNFPYLLPSLIAGLILFAGSFLACFLGHDGTATSVQPHPEKIEIHSPNSDFEVQHILPTTQSPNRTLQRRESSIYTLTANGLESRVQDHSVHSTGTSSGIPMGPRTITMSSSRSNAMARSQYSTFDRTSGSQYRQTVPLSFYPEPDSRSVVERVVLANENAINSIADLWVAAALNIEGNDDDGTHMDASHNIFEFEDGFPVDVHSHRGRSDHPSHLHSTTKSPSDASLSVYQSAGGTSTPRQFPSIFTNSGVSTPHDVFENPAGSPETDLTTYLERELPPILESRQPSAIHLNVRETAPLLDMGESSPSPPLPWLVIIQFGLLALHTTTHDQVFMSYLVSDYDAGGLSLNASDFAQLIGLMGFAQIIYQFHLYPPPRGRLSHLTMYRLGTILFIPAYLTVVLYRTPFGYPDDHKKSVLMTVLALSTSVRYCGITFAFTSISVLLNCLTRPEDVGYANGLAQTIVSLARCLGPVLGGWLWSVSVEGHPSGYPCGFLVCTVMCIVTVAMTVFIH
ncbi:major facilitator superfamily domain-containing protein [Lentinula aff. lateritia]|uniref:Major facilitator superfamily domain-containing protein n=1 Tax=Lentinula aff. lateritia TaxID=2804960 RepID=A0ACC1TQL2_9AGAR|nr:major facilitator superfamily domain-containing protein [Lentinula aff. lateritia]